MQRKWTSQVSFLKTHDAEIESSSRYSGFRGLCKHKEGKPAAIAAVVFMSDGYTDPVGFSNSGTCGALVMPLC